MELTKLGTNLHLTVLDQTITLSWGSNDPDCRGLLLHTYGKVIGCHSISCSAGYCKHFGLLLHVSIFGVCISTQGYKASEAAYDDYCSGLGDLMASR